MALMLVASLLTACSSEEDPVEHEETHVTNEGPYGGHSVKWYKIHWRKETKDERRWCQQQEAAASIQSCINAETGWKQGWADPATNPPRRWDDGPRLDG